MEEVKKIHKLAIYMLKPDVKDYSQALETNLNCKEYNFNEKIQVEGKVIVGNTRTKKPNWKNLLQQGVDGEIPDITNSSNRAVVFFKIKGRIFAIPFGYGKHLIKDEAIERDFGLKTALNIIDADKLLSVDKANVGDLSLQTRMQASRKGGPASFDIDIMKDLLRSVTGEPNLILPEEFGSVLTGNEGIYISPSTNMLEIPKILFKLREEYNKETYKERFEWIDRVKTEKDPSIIEELRKKLLIDIKSKNNENVSLAPPYIIDWQHFEGISFKPKGDLFYGYNIEDFYTVKEDLLDELDWEKLSKLKIYIENSNEGHRFGMPLWRFINYETEFSGHKYVFTLSNWYKIDKTYFSELYNYCKGIEESSVICIPANPKESEEDYNARLAGTNPDFINLDRNLIKSDTPSSQVEACDIFTKNKEFIHIKVRYSSATLSHLFSQGRISSYSLIRDRTFRKNLRSKIGSLGLDINLIPLEMRDIVPSEYTVTYAVIEKKDRNFVDSLPFFSLVNFRLTAGELIERGFKVKIKKIKRL